MLGRIECCRGECTVSHRRVGLEYLVAHRFHIDLLCCHCAIYVDMTTLLALAALSAECQATLIARKVLLTSVYCADSSLNYASIGSRYSSGDKDGERIKIVKKTVHPQYNEETLDYNFAILELETESKFPPAALNWDEDAATEPGTVSWVRGFGAPATVDEISGSIAFVRQNSPVLLQAEATILSNDDCQKATKNRAKIFDSMLCTKGANHDACTNYDGGPLVIARDGVEYVAGVLSRPLGCIYAKNHPNVYSRVSVAREFIKPFLPDTPTIPKVAC
ncbi:hypothetical protein DYB32_010646 [Aphanomyces invadans]|uniref:Peptidase S1 domain-containing protein n=1 Tax=Aphanomyces invadans TaxID=157072 RepID=A0A3R6YQY2_9STRA|nr:hypothetical protein DYB32_010646 [Aphanomyces invadans]